MSSTKSFGPERFHRHAFVWFQQDVAAHAEFPDGQPADPKDILHEWLQQGRPLVVRRPCLTPDAVCVGLSLPPCPHKRRLAWVLPRSSVLEVAEPPLWKEDAAGAAEPIRAAAEAAGVKLRMFGSHAWEHLTGLPYVTKTSDIDLLLFLKTRASWKKIREDLEQVTWPSAPRIDLEIVLNNDASFSWKEYAQAAPRLLFKGNSRVWMGKKRDVEEHLCE
jgi:phosphoribosyl-dephospho-CoA transferase